MQRLYCADISEVCDNYFFDNIESNYRQNCIAAKDVLITFYPAFNNNDNNVVVIRFRS